jgi:hypothetical protein
MANKGQALRPETFSIPSFIQKEREKDVVELTDDEKVLGAGADQKFWKILRKHIENKIIELDKISEAAIVQGLPLEEIGRNTIVISQVKGVINAIFNLVDDARESIENGNK